MKFEDEAFVYLWQDGRQKPYRYYLGYHKGNPDDSYTHSSSVFESFSKDSIPDGVKRRVIATGSAEEMMELENKILKNRKGSRKWDRYYNVMTNFPPYMWEDPAYSEKMSEKMKKQNKKFWADPAFREMQSKSTKKLWEDPAFREMKTEKMSEQMKKQWEDPAYREKMAERRKKQWEDPAFREKMGAKWKDPAFREMQSKSTKKQWEDPAFREMKTESSKKQMKKQWEDPAYREMQSVKVRQQWEDPAYREKMTEKHTCTVCGFVALKRNIARWHNDNCKHKNPLHELTEDDK